MIFTSHIARGCGLALILLYASNCALLASDFLPLGAFPSDDDTSRAIRVSGDGSTVIGLGDGAFVWNRADGIGPIASGEFVVATDLSFDGSVITGRANVSPGQTDGVIWSEANGFVVLSHPSGFDRGVFANAISGDGQTVVGDLLNLSPGAPLSREAFRWTAANGVETFNAGQSSTAKEVSFDGTVIVGEKIFGPIEEGEVFSYRWTEPTGFTSLGDIVNGNADNGPIDVSPDGTTIVGIAGEIGPNEQGFRWNSATNMVGLGDLPGGDLASIAWGVSADGNIVVGAGNTGNPQDPFGREAFIWDPINGMRNLQQVLENDFGLADQLTGWSLVQASDVSDDGRVIIGTGINPQGNQEAWVAIIPEPSSTLLVVIAFGILAPRRSLSRW